MKTKLRPEKERISEMVIVENRVFEFANKVRLFVKKLRETTSNAEDIKKIKNSSCDIGLNYIQAHNFLDKKEFIHQIRICQKKAEESRFWLSLLDTDWNPEQEMERKKMVNEAIGLVNIFNFILHSGK